MESERIHVKALVVADYSERYSHWNAKESLASWLKREKIPGITGIDTRRLTKVLREHGVMMGRISLTPDPQPHPLTPSPRGEGEAFGREGSSYLQAQEAIVEQMEKLSTPLSNRRGTGGEADYGSVNWVEKVSCKEIIRYNVGADKKVVLVDCGVKANIIRCLIRRGVEVIRVPWDYDFNQLEFDGLFLANGPGDPEQCGKTVEHIRTFQIGRAHV